jgi:myo-inositol 2-dehydrogenase / D-chiro-inositol 1-dehydrogenase
VTVRIGIIGTGMIGEDHTRRLTDVISGAEVTAVTDVDADRAKEVADRFGGTAAVHSNGHDVIADDNVDAVVIASWGPSHAEFVLACVAAGKPVFCEKPLATTAEDCRRIVETEAATGRRLIQVGFMRRYDAAYQALKQVVDAGTIGAPLLMHCAHRNASVPDSVTTAGVLTDSVVHEVDLVRWLFDDEIASVRVLLPKRSSLAAAVLHDPLVVVFELAGGIMIDVELSVNIRYGYDIRGEVVGEIGVAQLADAAKTMVSTTAGSIRPVPADWRERFISAYDTEFQEWVDGVAAGADATGPSAWDGYAATVVTDACNAAYETQSVVTIELGERPVFYATGGTA